jgi:hypothetical protein
LVSALVTDARVVLEAVQGADLDATQAEAVGLGGLVAGQDVEPSERPGTFRIARKVAADRVISTVDPDPRHLHQSRSSDRDGYKMECGGTSPAQPKQSAVRQRSPASRGDPPGPMSSGARGGPAWPS